MEYICGRLDSSRLLEWTSHSLLTLHIVRICKSQVYYAYDDSRACFDYSWISATFPEELIRAIFTFLQNNTRFVHITYFSENYESKLADIVNEISLVVVKSNLLLQEYA